MFNKLDTNRIDFDLLCDGSITMFWRPEFLNETVHSLVELGYKIDTFDCLSWSTEDDIHDDFARVFEFPEYYGRNLDALSDCLGDVDVQKSGGRALVFMNFDSFTNTSEIGWHILDILEGVSRTQLLYGCKLLTLLQSNDPKLEIKPVGANAVKWNSREWLNRNRGI